MAAHHGSVGRMGMVGIPIFNGVTSCRIITCTSPTLFVEDHRPLIFGLGYCMLRVVVFSVYGSMQELRVTGQRSTA